MGLYPEMKDMPKVFFYKCFIVFNIDMKKINAILDLS